MNCTALFKKTVAISATEITYIAVPSWATHLSVTMESTVAAANLRVRNDVRYLYSYTDYWRGTAWVNTTGTSAKLAAQSIGGTKNIMLEITNAGVSSADWNIVVFFQGKV